MIRLVPVDARRWDSWRDCLEDFAGGPVDGSGFGSAAGVDLTATGFETYVNNRLEAEEASTLLPEGWVRCSYRWIVDEAWGNGGDLLGFLSIRHQLTPFLYDKGGHIGYSVRPSRRREGVGTRALIAGLGEARGLGADPTLLTCHRDNLASRRLIESAGGVPDEPSHDYLRYWFGRGDRPPRPAD